VRGAAQASQVRIIAGRWRGRRLPVVDVPGLRPTPDRTRETLFNWLAPRLRGAACLDLFAGSGALGFEALSRGAGSVTLVERDARVVRQLQASAQLLGAEPLQIQATDALTFLNAPPRRFEVVFLDPPFRQGLLAPTLQRLQQGDWLADHADIYVEVEREAACPALPAGWNVRKQGQAGQVAFYLLSNVDDG
jgi:16S rRNA (guanine966-N2)-methyltransferase